MKRAALALAACLAALALAAPAAQAEFGIFGYNTLFEEEDGSTATQAGGHPFALTASLGVNFTKNAEGRDQVEGRIKDIVLKQAPGLVADTTAYPRCSSLQFLAAAECPPETQVGITAASSDILEWRASPVYNLTPPPGVLMRIGWNVGETANIVIDLGLTSEPPYVGFAASHNTPQPVDVIGVKTQIWGIPTDPAHDPFRGECLVEQAHDEPSEGGTGEVLGLDQIEAYEFEGNGGSCGVKENPKPFLTSPTECREALPMSFQATSWQGGSASGSILTHNRDGSPQPFTGCDRLGFAPSIEGVPTTRAATSASGLDFTLSAPNEGLTSSNEGAVSASAIEKTVVTLPKGMTVNPSQAEGLKACSEADLARETLAAAPGEGCPQAAKIGTIEVETPLLDKTLDGSLFVAEPYHNLAGNSLIALYVVIKDPGLGIDIKQPLKVTPNPSTGQLVTTAEDMPQLPFSAFRLHFREGARAPLISPPGCGHFDTTALLYPWSGTAPVQSTSTFQIISGPNAAPCPSGTAPFAPTFEAGTLNNSAARYSEFDMRIARGDGEQDLTKLSQILPPGVVGKIAGIPYCPDSGIARAMSRTGEHGGTAELADPSCPAASQIGRTEAGAGVGSELTYVPGRLYLAGPYHGDPLSVVSITPAVAGPFDAGTVVVRFALTLNPVTGEVELDGAASDPIPHILQGIPLNVRDLRAYVDKPDFTLNATSCEEEKARATLFGGGTLLAPLPDHPVKESARYQAASCASLGFKPKLAIKLQGGTLRGAHPALRATVTARPFKDANFSRAVVTLPHSAFLDQAHIRTICTRVQFAAGAGNGAQCPAGAVYGHAKVWTPLLSKPLEGPVFLRSSSHNLPDLVFALHGIVDIDLDARIDSIHGGIRSTFAAIPDAPASRVLLVMQGGKKGLIVNSRNLCAGRNRAKADITGQNGRSEQIGPVVRASKCGGARHKRHKGHRRG